MSLFPYMLHCNQTPVEKRQTHSSVSPSPQRLVPSSDDCCQPQRSDEVLAVACRYGACPLEPTRVFSIPRLKRAYSVVQDEPAKLFAKRRCRSSVLPIVCSSKLLQCISQTNSWWLGSQHVRLCTRRRASVSCPFLHVLVNDAKKLISPVADILQMFRVFLEVISSSLVVITGFQSCS